jgi:hypothetical protein
MKANVLIGAILVSILALCMCRLAHAATEHFSSYEQVASSDLPTTVLWKIIAREGKSKHYTDLVPLDGGTVGIANFARGGLASLYRKMDTQKYFGRSVNEMVSNYSVACRPKGKSGNDTGWGCYSKSWWHDGMETFLHSPESQEEQNHAWLKLMQPVIVIALQNGWNTSRSLAIALGVANSIGSSGFTKLANECNWDPETVLLEYVGNDAHRARRRDALNATFPLAK